MNAMKSILSCFRKGENVGHRRFPDAIFLLHAERAGAVLGRTKSAFEADAGMKGRLLSRSPADRCFLKFFPAAGRFSASCGHSPNECFSGTTALSVGSFVQFFITAIAPKVQVRLEIPLNLPCSRVPVLVGGRKSGCWRETENRATENAEQNKAHAVPPVGSGAVWFLIWCLWLAVLVK